MHLQSPITKMKILRPRNKDFLSVWGTGVAHLQGCFIVVSNLLIDKERHVWSAPSKLPALSWIDPWCCYFPPWSFASTRSSWHFSFGSSTVLPTKEALTTGDMERKSPMTNDAIKSGESWGQAVYRVFWSLFRSVFDFACSNADSEENHLWGVRMLAAAFLSCQHNAIQVTCPRSCPKSVSMCIYRTKT